MFYFFKKLKVKTKIVDFKTYIRKKEFAICFWFLFNNKKMKLKTKHSIILDFLLSIITFGIWGLYVKYTNLREGGAVAKESLSESLVLVLLCIPATSFIGGILLLINIAKAIRARGELLQQNGLKPQTTPLRYVLSKIFGFVTLFIWPLVEEILSYRLWNKANEIYNQQV